MPRPSRKSAKAATSSDVQNEPSPALTPPTSTAPITQDVALFGVTSQNDSGTETAAIAPRFRSFKSTLSVRSKGVTLGERNGHDWVISFPEDPGRATKDKLADAGFTYRDGKWKLFTHAANRQQVEAVAKEIKRQAGDEVAINDYPVRQVVLAFDAPPGEDITARLREADFHYRPDRTWNVEYNPQNLQFARDFIQSLPDKARSVAG